MKSGINRYEALHQLVVQFADIDNAKALEYASRAEEVAVQTEDTLCIRKSRRLKAQILLRLGRPMEAMTAIQSYVRERNLVRMDEEQLMLTNMMGVSHLLMAQFDKALEYYLGANDLAKKLKNAEYLEISVENIGITYYKLKAYDKALSYLLRSHEMEDSLKANTFRSALNISLCYSYLGDFHLARMFLEKSTQACGSNCSPSALTHIKYAAGCLYYSMKQREKAKNEFSQSMRYATQVDDRRMMLDNIYFLAKLSLEDNDYEKAGLFLRTGERIIGSGAPFNMEIIKIYEQLAELYLEARNFSKASAYQSKYIRYRDSLYNEAVITHLMQLEAEYLQKVNESKIEQQAELIHLNQEIIGRQAKLNILSVIVVILTLVVIFILFRNYRRKQLLNELLNQKVDERTRELELSRHELFEQVRRQELFFAKTCYRVSERINTLKGLCIAAKAEMLDFRGHTYLEKIRCTSEEIDGVLKSTSSIETG